MVVWEEVPHTAAFLNRGGGTRETEGWEPKYMLEGIQLGESWIDELRKLGIFPGPGGGTRAGGVAQGDAVDQVLLERLP